MCGHFVINSVSDSGANVLQDELHGRGYLGQAQAKSPTPWICFRYIVLFASQVKPSEFAFLLYLDLDYEKEEGPSGWMVYRIGWECGIEKWDVRQ
jgi:hypothetical protein